MSKRKNSSRTKRRGNSFFDPASLAPILLLVLILAAAVGMTLVVTDLDHLTRIHPRIARFCTYMVHFHPRMTQAALVAALLSPTALQLLMAKEALTGWRRRGLLCRGELATSVYLNQPLKVQLPVVVPEAWKTLKLYLSEQIIKTAKIRRTHWEVINVDEQRRQLELVLRYVPYPPTPHRPYVRTLNCTARVAGPGIRSEVELTFQAKTVLDYQTVQEIIEQTKLAAQTAVISSSPVRS